MVLGRKITTIQAYLKKQVKFQINDLNLYLEELKKEEYPKASRRKKIKFRAEIDEVETRKRTEQINETRSCVLRKLNKIDKPLARFVKNKKKENSNK